MTPNFHLLSVAGNALISTYIGAGSYIFKTPPEGGAIGSGPMRAFKICFAVDKATSISDASDYLKLESSPDEGSTWFGIPEDGSSSDAFNFLTGKTGTSVSFETVIWLTPGQWVRLKANAGLTLTKVGIVH